MSAEEAAALEVGDVVSAPSQEQLAAARLTDFARQAAERCGVDLPEYDYEALWRCSVEHVEDFWAQVWRYFDVGPDTSYDAVLAERGMPGAVWFPGARLNYAERVLAQGAGHHDETVLVAVAENDEHYELTWGELAAQVGAVAGALRTIDVRQGDRVVGYLPNVPQAIVAFLAAASLGAVWSACGPEIGLRSAVDRFAQLEPVVLIAADGYRFGGKVHDRTGLVADLVAALPSLREVVHVRVVGEREPGPGRRWAEPADVLAPVRVPFDHPLWVVYSSGTTGRPKGLVHGHGGILLTSLVQHFLQSEAQPGSRRMSFTSTTWIMWNSTVSGLLGGGTAILYDGNPMYPSVDRLWQLAEEYRLTSLGVSPAYLKVCEKAGLHPAQQHDLPLQVRR